MYKLQIKVIDDNDHSITFDLYTNETGSYCSGIELAEHLVDILPDTICLDALAEMAEEVIEDMEPDRDYDGIPGR